MNTIMEVITIGNRKYACDTEAIEVLTHAIRSARESNDFSAVLAAIILGEKRGQIVRVS